MSKATHVALLRGINVGGKNKLPMKELVSIFEEVGCGEVRTYIQSGNVIFRSTAAAARKLPSRITAAIDERCGYRVPVVLRDAAALRATLAANPFLKDGAETAHLHVAFLSAKPKPAAVKALDPDRSPPDRFAVIGSEIHLCCPGGVARSKLTNAWFDRALGVTSTARNWNTLQKLIALSSGEA